MRSSLLRGLLAAALAATSAAGLAAPGGVTDRPIGGSEMSRRPVTPEPTTGPTHQNDDVGPALRLLAPTGLGSTTDVAACNAHGGFGAGLACKALLPAGRLALIWNAAGGTVSGYHIYSIRDRERVHVGDQANGATATAYVVDPPPAGGYAGVCYEVTAYNAAGEGPASPVYCVAAGAVIQTMTLSPTQLRSVLRAQSSVSKSPNNSATRADGPTGLANPAVGSWHGDNTALLQDKAANYIYRTAMAFDLSPLAGKRILSASLRLSVDSAYLNGVAPFDGENPSDHRTSCIAKIGLGVDYWWTHADWIDDNLQASPGENQGPNVALDVTALAQTWQSGASNYGLVLQGENEDLNAFTKASCVSTYFPDKIKLVVQYQ